MRAVAQRSVRGALKLEIDEIGFLFSTPGPRNGGGGLNRSAHSAGPKERIAGTVASLQFAGLWLQLASEQEAWRKGACPCVL